MNAKINIVNQNSRTKLAPGIKLLIRRACHAVLENDGFDKKTEVNIALMDNISIAKLNSTYRNKDSATDVLSFPTLDENGNYETNPETGVTALGDIAISIEYVEEQANRYSRTFMYEICAVTVHSMFHLLGYDHEKSSVDAVNMREREAKVLEKMGMSLSLSYVV